MDHVSDLGALDTYQSYRLSFNEYEIKHAPDSLFWEGDFSLLKKGRRVSVVGSRKASPEGIKRAIYISKKLVEHNIIVVSGLAEGIDTAAHTTAIEEKGSTIAVIGTPLNQVYPKSNKELFEIIKEDHLVVSQFPIGYPFNKTTFPMRNRTMALISDATIIVEAAESSGTRHQGWEALRIGRKVYIMQNVFDVPDIKWPFEMLNYGAEKLTKESLDDLLFSIPSFTAEVEYEF